MLLSRRSLSNRFKFWMDFLKNESSRRLRSRSQAAGSHLAAEVEGLESRALLTFTFHGGSLITNVEAQNVFLGSDWSTNANLQPLEGRLESFLTTAVTGLQIDGLTQAGYNVYRGTSSPGVVGNFTLDKSYPTSGYIQGNQFVDTSSFTGGLADDTTQTGFANSVQGLLQTMINAGAVQQPDANRLYMVYVEPGVIVTSADGTNSVVDFLGFHSSFTGTNAAGQAADIRYALMPFPGFPNNLFGIGSTQVLAGALNSLTNTTSHELSEAVTDPDVQFTINTGDDSFLGWYDDDNNGEVGDLSTQFSTIDQGYVLQQMENINNELINPNVVPHVLAAPTNLSLSALTDTTASLSWTASPLAQGYNIFSISGGIETEIGTVGAAVTKFTVTTPGSFMVQAYDGPSTTADSSVLSSASAFFIPAGAPAISLAGSWVVTGGGTTTLAKINQSSNVATLTKGATTITANIGYSAAYGQTLLQLPGNTIVAVTNNSFTYNGQVWTKLSLAPNFTSSYGGATSVSQNGSTLTFVNNKGKTSTGYWLSPTKVVATAFGKEVGTVSGGNIKWSTGEVWTVKVAMPGSAGGVKSASPMPIVTLIDTKGYSYKVEQLTSTEFVVIDGSLIGTTITKQNGSAVWSNSGATKQFSATAVGALFHS
jgi:hypothetical protein